MGRRRDGSGLHRMRTRLDLTTYPQRWPVRAFARTGQPHHFRTERSARHHQPKPAPHFRAPGQPYADDEAPPRPTQQAEPAPQPHPRNADTPAPAPRPPRSGPPLGGHRAARSPGPPRPTHAPPQPRRPPDPAARQPHSDAAERPGPSRQPSRPPAPRAAPIPAAAAAPRSHHSPFYSPFPDRSDRSRQLTSSHATPIRLFVRCWPQFVIFPARPFILSHALCGLPKRLPHRFLLAYGGHTPLHSPALFE